MRLKEALIVYNRWQHGLWRCGAVQRDLRRLENGGQTIGMRSNKNALIKKSKVCYSTILSSVEIKSISDISDTKDIERLYITPLAYITNINTRRNGGVISLNGVLKGTFKNKISHPFNYRYPPRTIN